MKFSLFSIVEGCYTPLTMSGISKLYKEVFSKYDISLIDVIHSSGYFYYSPPFYIPNYVKVRPNLTYRDDLPNETLISFDFDLDISVSYITDEFIDFLQNLKTCFNNYIANNEDLRNLYYSGYSISNVSFVSFDGCAIYSGQFHEYIFVTFEYLYHLKGMYFMNDNSLFNYNLSEISSAGYRVLYNLEVNLNPKVFLDRYNIEEDAFKWYLEYVISHYQKFLYGDEEKKKHIVQYLIYFSRGDWKDDD